MMATRSTPQRKTDNKDTSLITPTPGLNRTRSGGGINKNDEEDRSSASNTSSEEEVGDNFVVDAANIVADTSTVTSPQKKHVTPKLSARSPATRAAAKAQAKVRQPPVKAGIRVKSRRSQLFHCLSPELQKYLPKEHPNFHNYYGTVVKKSVGRTASYDINFDVFRANETAQGLRRNVFTTVKKGDEEAAVDPRYIGKLAMDKDMADKHDTQSEWQDIGLSLELLFKVLILKQSPMPGTTRILCSSLQRSAIRLKLLILTFHLMDRAQGLMAATPR